jgi:hypothetical protein
MQGQNVSKICKSIFSFFNKSAFSLGKKTKFIRRTSKITAKLFVESLIVGCLSHPTMTLEDMRHFLKKRKVKVSKQGIHERFTEEGVELVKNLHKEALEHFKLKHTPVLELLKPFSSVILLDSSGVSLPPQLKSFYRGFGGAASEAGLKIQTLFDYTNGQIKDVTLTGARENDQSFKKHLDQIEEGALYLQDLGYFDTGALKLLHHKKAFFISRYLQQTKVFSSDGECINLLEELRKAGTFYKKEILLGQKHKVNVRLIAYLLPECEIEKRLRKLNREAEKKGRTLTQEAREYAKWSIFITNVDSSLLSDYQVYLVYLLRWQIELFFKLCKSGAGIHKINGRKHDRVICEIYAKLICITLLLYICFPVRWEKNQEISFYKAYQQFRQRALEFFTALTSQYRLSKFLDTFWEDLRDFALKEKPRKKRQATYQKIMSAVGHEVFL